MSSNILFSDDLTYALAELRQWLRQDIRHDQLKQSARTVKVGPDEKYHEINSYVHFLNQAGWIVDSLAPAGKSGETMAYLVVAHPAPKMN